jgi:uroporphyrinogen-III synthase
MIEAKKVEAQTQERLKPVKSILITQSFKPEQQTPYQEIEKKFDTKVDFRSFIEVKGIEFKEFRKTKIDILSHTAVIFTSRHAIDHFFRVCEEAKIEMPADMKYYCITEQTANYLQKYITIRKRKLFVGQRTASDLLEVIKKSPTEKFIFPCSDVRTNDIPDFMAKHKIALTEAVMYQTVCADLSDLENVFYDIIAFYSPSGIKSLFENFPNFKQNNTRIAVFGPTTAQAALDANLIVDILAPQPSAPSMTGAIENYILEVNK